MDKQLIDKLRKRAQILLGAVEYRQRDDEARHAQGDFKKWRDNGENMWYELLSHNEIAFYCQGTGNKNQTVYFRNIRPTAATDVVIHPPIVKDRKIIDASVHTVVNKSDCTIERSYEVEKGSETNVSTEFGVGASLSLRTMFRFGNDNTMVGNETEISATIETSYSKSNSKTETSTISTGTSVEIPPKTSVTFTTSRSVAKYEQNLEYVAKVDHETEVVLERHGDWRRSHWVEFDSWPEALRIMNGGGYKNDDYQSYVEKFRRKPIADWEREAFEDVKGVSINVKVEFDEATVTDVAVESNPVR